MAKIRRTRTLRTLRIVIGVAIALLTLVNNVWIGRYLIVGEKGKDPFASSKAIPGNRRENKHPLGAVSSSRETRTIGASSSFFQKTGRSENSKKLPKTSSLSSNTLHPEEDSFSLSLKTNESKIGWLQALPLLPQIRKNCTVIFQDNNNLTHICYSSTALVDQVALQVALRLLEYRSGCSTDSLPLMDVDNITTERIHSCFFVRPQLQSDTNQWSNEESIFLLPFLIPDFNNRPTFAASKPLTHCVLGKAAQKMSRSIKLKLYNVPDWRHDVYDHLVYCDLVTAYTKEATWIAQSLAIPVAKTNTSNNRDLHNPALYPTQRHSPFKSLQSKLDYPRAESIAQSFPFQHFQTKPVYETHPSQALPKNRTLVIIIGSLRGGERSWESMYKHLLDINQADLALMVGGDGGGQNNTLAKIKTTRPSPYHRAKYVWEFPEYEDWADAIDTIDGPRWREKLVYHRKSGLLGGARGDSGSGAIIFMARHWVLQKLEELQLTQTYDRFVVTRSDFYYKCSQDLSRFDERYVWVPSERDFGGITDRHVIAPAGLIGKVLNILPPLLRHPERYARQRLQTTPEGQIWLEWTMQGIYPHHVRRFPMMMYTCAVDGDSTRWQRANTKKGLTEDGVYIKYEAEYTFSKCFCEGGAIRDTDDNAHPSWSLPTNWTSDDYTDGRQFFTCTPA